MEMIFARDFFFKEGLPPAASRTVSKMILKSPEKIA